MKPRYQVSETGLQLIMSFEGYRASSAQLADGRWTIGYGHTKTARPGVRISEADAKILLLYDLSEINLALHDLVFTPLNQNQIDALGSFTFNIGLDAFQGSAVLQRINEGALLQAACALDLWRRAELHGEAIVVDALVRRRAAEKALFLTPPMGWTPAPSPVVKAALDHDIDGSVPRTRPVEVHAPLDGAFATAEVVHETAPAFGPEPEPANDIEASPKLTHAPEAEIEDVQAETAHEAHGSVGSQLHDTVEAISERLHALLPEAEIAAPAADAPEVEAAEAHIGHEIPTAESVTDEHPELASVQADAASPGPAETVIAVLEGVAAPVSHQPLETETQAELDEVPTNFRPIPVAHDVFLNPSAAPAIGPAQTLEPEIAIAPEAPAKPDVASAPTAWSSEAFRHPTLFPGLDSAIDTRTNFRTPAAARFAGFEVANLDAERRSLTPFIVLGGVGVALFAGSVFWSITARTGGLINPLVMGGTTALIGIGCVVAAVYFLVHRFLGREI